MAMPRPTPSIRRPGLGSARPAQRSHQRIRTVQPSSSTCIGFNAECQMQYPAAPCLTFDPAIGYYCSSCCIT